MASRSWGQGGRKRPKELCGVERRRAADELRAGAGVAGVAARFGVSERTVHRIRDHDALVRRRWSHSGFRLRYEERVEIQMRCEEGQSVRRIAGAIGRSASTVCRELARNGGRERYRAQRAEARAQACARRPKPGKLAGSPALWAEVWAWLRRRWSPEQIAATLKRDHPDDRGMQISHESIYRALYVQSRGELRRELTGLLRTRRVTRKSQGRVQLRGRLVGMVPIAERPPEADDRRVPGHWEGDLLLGGHGSSAIVTLVERHSRYVLLAPLRDRTTEHVIEVLQGRIQHLPAHLLRSLTWDQGRELAAHARFTEQTGVPVYFCDPHSPWQRGSNENTNGLLRQYLPKGSDLSMHDQAALDEVAAELNGRPRKTLGWDNPAERMAVLLGEPGPVRSG
ncbi:MAG TPA: IS30 family transposase [Solirubrobacteraceae bacterium]